MQFGANQQEALRIDPPVTSCTNVSKEERASTSGALQTACGYFQSQHNMNIHEL